MAYSSQIHLPLVFLFFAARSVEAADYSFDLPAVVAGYNSVQPESLEFNLDLGLQFSQISAVRFEIKGNFSLGVHDSGQDGVSDLNPIFADFGLRLDDPDYRDGEIVVAGLSQVPYSDDNGGAVSYGPRDAIAGWTFRSEVAGDFQLEQEMTSSVLRSITQYTLAEGASPPPAQPGGPFPPDLSFLRDGTARLTVRTSWMAKLSDVYWSISPDLNLPGIISPPRITLTGARLTIVGAAVPEPNFGYSLVLIIGFALATDNRRHKKTTSADR
jgi:hypothetical protein